MTVLSLTVLSLIHTGDFSPRNHCNVNRALIKISFKFLFFIKIAKFQLNNFKRFVININGENGLVLEGWVVGGCCTVAIVI